ncbi:hypothetical protein D4764_07G0011740 [Takifugu flavidus]|uniref:Uncharacterized protein n=1 Tax=Takifugu flavidus TaxID=433684 RepID=A0A5C6MUC3_9TELE|nr:hypothetical protein D4764_07G0011740 [Takifugu flavidus]
MFDIMCSLGGLPLPSVSRGTFVLRRTPESSPVQEDWGGVEHNWVQLALQDCSCSPCSLGGLPLPSVSRGTFVLRRTPESSPVQEDCSVLRTHRCSEFPAVQGDCVWFGDSPMDLGRADAASRSPCGPGGLQRVEDSPVFRVPGSPGGLRLEDCSVLRTHRCSEFPAVQGDCVWFGDSPMDLGRADAASRSPCGPGGLQRVEDSPVFRVPGSPGGLRLEDCSVLRTHRCSEFPAVQGDCVWFGDSPMDLGRADAASRSPCAFDLPTTVSWPAFGSATTMYRNREQGSERGRARERGEREGGEREGGSKREGGARGGEQESERGGEQESERGESEREGGSKREGGRARERGRGGSERERERGERERERGGGVREREGGECERERERGENEREGGAREGEQESDREGGRARGGEREGGSKRAREGGSKRAREGRVREGGSKREGGRARERGRGGSERERERGEREREGGSARERGRGGESERERGGEQESERERGGEQERGGGERERGGGENK